MKFGIFGGGKIGKGNPLGDSYAFQEFIRYVLDAEDLGFDSAFMVEHHFTGVGQISASLALLTYLAARTKRIRLGSAVIVLPWHNPVLLAEQVAALDVLSGGRYEMGVGRGYRKDEFERFCIPMSEAQERYLECFQLLMKSLTSKERFSYHGKYWNLRISSSSLLRYSNRIRRCGWPAVPRRALNMWRARATVCSLTSWPRSTRSSSESIFIPLPRKNTALHATPAAAV